MKKAATAETLPAVRQETIEVPMDFTRQNKVMKARMIMEYNGLPEDEKQGWRERHNCSQAKIRYYRGIFQHGRQRRKPVATIPDPVKVSARRGEIKERLAKVTQEMLDEYLALPHIGGHKSAWLKAHNLNHQQIFDVKKRLGPKLINSNGKNQFVERIQPAHPPLSTTSLDDAINAMKVKRDMMSEFIMDLERMRH